MFQFACTLSVLLPANPLAATFWTLSRCELPAVRPADPYTHIVLRSIPQPQCRPFWMENLNQIHYILVGPNADIIVLWFVDWRKCEAWYFDIRYKNASFGWMNHWIVCKAYCLPAMMEGVGFWKYWFLFVKRRFYTGCTTKTKGHLNPRKLPDGATCLHAQRPDGRIGWQKWSLAAAS